MTAKPFQPQCGAGCPCAGSQPWGFRLVRHMALAITWTPIFLWERDPIKADVCAKDMAMHTEASVIVCDDLAAMVPDCDILVTTTPSMAPLIEADWASAGTHIKAMGSDLPGKQELSVALLQRADRVVCDSLAQCRVGGEL